MNELAHIGLYVKDLDRSIAFYGEVFGFKVTRTMELGESSIAFLDIGGGLLELIQRPDAPGTPPKGRWTHVAISVENYGAMEEMLEKMGLEMRKVRLSSGIRIAFFKDPDGHDIEIMERLQ